MLRENTLSFESFKNSRNFKKKLSNEKDCSEKSSITADAEVNEISDHISKELLDKIEKALRS